MDRFTEFDFGITMLASNFHVDWMHVGSVDDVLDDFLWERQDGKAVQSLHRDADLMCRGLTNVDIERIWSMAVEGKFQFGAEAESGTGWLRLVMAKCDAWFGGSPVPQLREPDNYAGFELADSISTEIVQIWQADEELASALRACVYHCTPDLAFRFLLRCITTQRKRVEALQYERFCRLGNALHYGEFLVSETEFLVE